MGKLGKVARATHITNWMELQEARAVHYDRGLRCPPSCYSGTATGFSGGQPSQPSGQGGNRRERPAELA